MPKNPYVIPGVARHKIGCEDVLSFAMEYFKVSRQQLLSDKRTRRLVEARRHVMWACRHKLNMTLKEIAKFFKKDHTTILHNLRIVRGYIQVYPDYGRELETFIKKLYS